MSSSYNSVIGALKDSLSKSDLDLRTREILKQRLEYHQDKLKQKRRGASRGHISNAQKISAQRRKERRRKKTQELLPLILRLRGEGKTYKVIEDHLRTAGLTNTIGNPYAKTTIGLMVRENSPRPARGRKVDASARRLPGRRSLTGLAGIPNS